MAQQVQQHDPVAAGGQPTGQAAAEGGVEQQRVQPHEHSVARAVDLVRELVLTIGQRVLPAFGILRQICRDATSAGLSEPDWSIH
jgi:hypothetical protein